MAGIPPKPKRPPPVNPFANDKNKEPAPIPIPVPIPVPSIAGANSTINAIPSIPSVPPNSKAVNPDFLISIAIPTPPQSDPTLAPNLPPPSSHPILPASLPSPPQSDPILPSNLPPPISSHPILPSSLPPPPQSDPIFPPNLPHPISSHPILPSSLPPPPQSDPILPPNLPPPPSTHPSLPSSLPPPPQSDPILPPNLPPPPSTLPILPSSLPPPPPPLSHPIPPSSTPLLPTYPWLPSGLSPPPSIFSTTEHPPPLPMVPPPVPLSEESFEFLPTAEYSNNEEENLKIPPPVPPIPAFPTTEPLEFDVGFVVRAKPTPSFVPMEPSSFDSFPAPSGNAFDAFDTSDDVQAAAVPPFGLIGGFFEGGTSAAESDPFSPAIVTTTSDPFAFPSSSTNQKSSDPFSLGMSQCFTGFQSVPEIPEININEIIIANPATTTTSSQESDRIAPAATLDLLIRNEEVDDSSQLHNETHQEPSSLPASTTQNEDPFLDFSGFQIKSMPVAPTPAVVQVDKPNQNHIEKKPSVVTAKVGDPFETLLPQMKSHSKAPVSIALTGAVCNEPLNSVPLNLMMQKQSWGLPAAPKRDPSISQPVSGLTTPAPVVGFPLSSGLSHSVNFDETVASISFSAPSVVGGFDAFSSSSEDSSARQSQSSSAMADDFGFPATVSTASVASNASSFGIPPPSSQLDPFDLTSIQPMRTVTTTAVRPSHSSLLPITQPAVVAHDFDIFGSSSNVIAPTKQEKPVAIAHSLQDDFDVFSHHSSSAAPLPHAPSTAMATDNFDIFTRTSNAFQQPAADSFNDDFDVFSLPARPATGDASMTSLHLLQQQQNIALDDFDGFDGDHSSDPFASAADDPFAAASSDPFAVQEADTPATARKKLREMYNIQADDVDDEDDDDDDDEYGRERRPNPNADRRFRSTDGKGPSAIAVTSESKIREGDILSRLSARTLMTKDWHDTYYVIDRGELFLYRNKLDYQYNRQGKYKKKIFITHNLRLLQIKAKEYKGYGTVYNFMLEEVLDYGPLNVGKFASTRREDVQRLWNYLKEEILEKRRARANPPSVYK